MYREYVGNPHVHSVYSGAAGTPQEIAHAAAAAGLNFVIVSDCNVRVRNLEAYHGRTLLLFGEEVYNMRRQPPANHLLVYDVPQEMTPYSFGSVQTLIETVRARGGFCYIAHPTNRRRTLSASQALAPWSHWPVEQVCGIEIWNYMAELRTLQKTSIAGSLYTLRPQLGITGPFRTTLRLWDELLLQGQRLAALGGAQAQANFSRGGGGTSPRFSYEHLFGCVNTHVLTQGPLSGETARDEALILGALRAGRTWVGYDQPFSTRGFRFVARSGSVQAFVGEELKRLGATIIEVLLPARGEIRLLRDGKCILRTNGLNLNYTSAEPGIYRVEVYRWFGGRRVGWIFSSPIYIV